VAASVEVNPKKQHKRTKKMRTVENSSPKREVRFVWRRTTESDVGGKKEEDGGRKKEEEKSWEGRAAWSQIRFICLASHLQHNFFFLLLLWASFQGAAHQKFCFAPPLAWIGAATQAYRLYRLTLVPIGMPAKAVWDPHFSCRVGMMGLVGDKDFCSVFGLATSKCHLER
jgi:hypothetical protein